MIQSKTKQTWYTYKESVECGWGQANALTVTALLRNRVCPWVILLYLVVPRVKLDNSRIEFNFVNELWNDNNVNEFNLLISNNCLFQFILNVIILFSPFVCPLCHRSLVNFPHIGQWWGALVVFFCCWETTLQCNVISHWLRPNPEWFQIMFCHFSHLRKCCWPRNTKIFSYVVPECATKAVSITGKSLLGLPVYYKKGQVDVPATYHEPCY